MKQFRASQTAANGNGSGSATGARAKIERLLAHHEQITAALRMTLGLLDDGAHASKQRHSGGVLADAIALDEARRGKGKKKPKKGAGSASAVHERRTATAAFLESFDDSKPSHGNGALVKSGIGTLLRHGYLKRKGDGYVRTAREFSVARP